MPATLALDPENPVVLHARVPLLESRNERGLGNALTELVRVTEKLHKAITRADEPPGYLRVTFHTPARRWVSERRFFERAAKYPSLRAATYAFVDQVNPKRWPKDPFRGAGFWTTNAVPAGSLPIVPLALRDRGALPVLGEHLRGADLEHETFHRALLGEVVARHGLVEEVLDLVAVRAVDAAGQHGTEDLRWLVEKTGFGALVSDPEGALEFAERVHRISKRATYRPLYVAQAGKALFARSEAQFRVWIDFFRDKGLSFDERDLALDAAPHDPLPPRAFAKEWEEVVTSDDVD
jgi:hypothetical protein